MKSGMIWAGERRNRLLAGLSAGTFLVSALFGIVLPIYTDEFGWRLQERAAIDGGVDISFSDICGANTIAHPPWFMMPVREISAVVTHFLADPIYVRATGIAFALAWAAMLWILTGLLERDESRRSLARALAFGLLGAGLLPLLMVMSRPEQPVITALISMVMVAVARFPRKWSPPAVAWLKAIAIVLLATIGLSFHLKGVVYAPVALACLLTCSSGRGTLLPRFFGLASVCALTVVSLRYWVHRFGCPDDAILAAQLAKENLAGSLSSAISVPDLLLKLIQGAYPFNYVPLVEPANAPMSRWLPIDSFSPAVIIGCGIALPFIWLAAGLVGLASLARFLRHAGIRGLTEPRVVMALSILACVMVWGMSQLNRNVYEASHVLPMLVLFGVLCLSLRGDDDTAPDPRLRYAAAAAVAIAVFSTVAVVGSLAGPLLARARSPGYVTGQPYSVSIAGYAPVRRDIDEAMRRSGMPRDRRLNRVMVDDVTYPALQDSRMPLHWLGVLIIWNGTISRPVDYLRSRQSDGVVMRCRFLPPNMRAEASQSGEICAVSRAGLDRVAADVAR